MAKVLIVEDKTSWQRLLKEELSEAGHQIVGTANCQRDAVQLFHEHSPDVITMDGMLLYGDLGLNVAAEIRKLNSEVIIILMVSGSGDTFEDLGFNKVDAIRDGNLLRQIEETLKTRGQTTTEA